MPVNKSKIINSGHGLYFEGGINPGKFISKKIVIGLYLGWAWKDGLWTTGFNSAFVSDYNSSINKEASFSPLDSSVISSSSLLFANTKGRSVTMPGCEMRSFHNYSLYYGLIIKLHCKYLPALKLYTGTTRTHYQGPGNIVTTEKDYNVFELRRLMYGCEFVMFKGLQKTNNRSFGTFSVYFENNSMYNSSLYFTDGSRTANIPLKKYLTNSFLQKYRSGISFGFKIACTIL